MHWLFNKQSQLFTTLRQRPFQNNVGKGENAGHQHFLFFPQCFLPIRTNSIICATLTFSSADAFNWNKAKILSCGKELIDGTLDEAQMMNLSMKG